jgi:hypothetical protein
MGLPGRSVDDFRQLDSVPTGHQEIHDCGVEFRAVDMTHRAPRDP